ncbi:MAG: hypothetical protein V4674_00790 [Patescibacteria group bacterium]
MFIARSALLAAGVAILASSAHFAVAADTLERPFLISGLEQSEILAWRTEASTIALEAGAPPKEAQAPSGITLVTSSQLKETILPVESNAFVATFQNTGLATTGLINLELKDSEGKKWKQAYWDNLMLGPGAYRTGVLETGFLPVGTYSWSAGVFDPSWGATREWHDSLLSFTVSTSTSATTTATKSTGFPIGPSVRGADWNGNIMVTHIEKPEKGRDVTLYLISTGSDAYGVTTHLLLKNPHTGEVVLDVTTREKDISSSEPQAYGLTVPPSFPGGTYGLAVQVYNKNYSLNSVFADLGTVEVQ